MPWLWDLYAHTYDAITALHPYGEMLDEVVRALDVKPGLRVLDAGCGTGALAERLATACPDIEYVGVDLSPSMLARAGARRAWPRGFTFVRGDLDALLANEASGFDRVASVNVIWTLPDPRGSLARMTAHLRPGGHMVHVTPRLRFRADAVVWRHLRSRAGWPLLGALLRLPILLVAGVLNLSLVARGALRSRARHANWRWSADGLSSLLREAGAEPRPIRSCYAGQGYLLVAARGGHAAVPGDDHGHDHEK